MKTTALLEQIQVPNDLKKLQLNDLQRLAAECRALITKTVSQNGGHLASNLGVVELCLALAHSLNFDGTASGDQLVWDVGHQSYCWKLISGRREAFQNLRLKDGLAGFPKREESSFDSFNTGHSSTSISAALGLARAKKYQKLSGRTVAVIGDGALDGGMAYEALNDCGHRQDDILIILNDNQMSIDESVGAMAKVLENLRVSRSYLNLKAKSKPFVLKIPLIGPRIYRHLRRLKAKLRTWKRQNSLWFEQLGFRYYGPIDGHDLQALCAHLEAAARVHGPVLLHVITRKGQGYRFAENRPADYHGVAPFVIEKGIQKKSNGAAKGQSFTELAGQLLVAAAEENPRLLAITAAMTSGTGLAPFADRFPDRFFDVGIAEQHAMTLAAGLAAGGMKPYLALYSTFMQRALDQLLHDVCLQNLPLVLLLDHSGYVSKDGETHQGVYDSALLKALPNLELLSPSDATDMKLAFRYAEQMNGPLAIRYPKTVLPSGEGPLRRSVTEALHLSQGDACTVLVLGERREAAVEACRILAEKQQSCDLFSLMTINNMQEDGMIESLQRTKRLFLIEESIARGALLESVGQRLQTLLPSCRIGYALVEHPLQGQAGRQELLAADALDAAGLVRRLEEFLCL